MDDRARAMKRPGLALLILCAALRVITLFRPCMSDDEATYSVVGREMSNGAALYKDVVDHKPPVIYILNEVCQTIAGVVGGQFLLHVLLILVVWATAMLCGRIAARIDPKSAFYAALLYIVFTTTLIDTDALAANCELFMMLPLVASVEALLAGQLVTTGMLVGAAILCKYQAGIQLPLYGLAIIIQQRKQPLRIVINGGLLAFGCALPIATAVTWLMYRGAWHDAWFWFRFNFAYIDTGSSTTKIAAMLPRIGLVIAGAAPLYIFAVLALRDRPPQRAIVLGWLVVSALAIVVGGRFFGHYFHQLTAPLAVLASSRAAAFAAKHKKVFIAALAVPALAFFTLAAAHDALMRAAGEPDPDYQSIVAYLDAHGSEYDNLCIWGNSPVLYFEAHQPLGCRFVFANYITGMSPATPSQTDMTADTAKNAVPIATDMMIADLAKRNTTFFVDASVGNVDFYGKYPPAKFPWLAHILACHYAPEADIVGMRIYRRLAVPRC